MSTCPSSLGCIHALPKSPWGKPPVFPARGQHPRVLFTRCRLGEIQANLTHPENQFAYQRMLALAQQTTDGMLAPPAPGQHNMDHELLAIIEAKAFLYALTKDVSLGRAAIHAMVNFIRTLNIPEGSYPDSCRAFGYAMYIAGCVYDWCYDLLAEEDKLHLVAGCENLLAPYLEIGMPPAGQSSLVGHGTEAQLLRDWLALSIAAYDEYPELYDYVAGRIFHDFKPSTEEYLRSGFHWQGCAYGPYRLYFLLFAQHLISCMTEGQCELFSPHLHDAARGFLHILRPDGQALRIGDDFNEYGERYALNCYHLQAFFASSLYHDSVLKGFAKKGLQGFRLFYYTNNALSPVMFLVLNQPKLPCAELEQLPKTACFGSPLGCCISRSSWGDSQASMVYMKIGESYTANHEHKDAGSFQIYSKGILASSSGTYDSYFTPHDIAYNKQTISSNSLLIINPRMKDCGQWVYSGGQTIQGNISEEHKTLFSWQASAAFRQAKVLSHAISDEYCSLCGDITRAYDPQTAEKVVRHMLSVFTKDEAHPLIFAVYDDIISADAAFRKVFLLHTQQQPRLTADGFAIMDSTQRGNHGQLVAQSCVYETDKTLVSGCQVNGKEPPLKRTFSQNSVCEIGWGRIEISPKHPTRQNRLFTLMYATDANSSEAPIRAMPIDNENLVGAALMGYALIFCLDDQPLRQETSFVCPGQGKTRVLLSGIGAGSWRVLQDGIEITAKDVQEGEQLLVFTAQAGRITLIPQPDRGNPS